MRRKMLNYSLPQDVMTEILMRLPFESILALKRVSKQWKDLINDPKFFNRYRDKFLAIFLSKHGLYCLLVRHDKKIPVTVNGYGHPPFTMRRITIETLDCNTAHSKRYSRTFPLDKVWFTVVLCNWMTYVVRRSGDFHLYNLLTGASCTVTDAPLQEQPYKGHTRWICHGFGYDSYEDDYKILVVCDYEFGDLVICKKVIRFVQNEGNSLFWVYSLRNRVWKRLKGFPYAAYGWNFGPSPQRCSLNGVLHWGLGTRVHKPVIVTYDLHTCRFGEISVPKGYNHLWANIGELRGQLCCWKVESKFDFHVWVMKEYGVSESWTVLFSIHVSTVNSRMFREWIEPAALYECLDGRKMLLLVCRIYGSFYWYDIHNDELKVIHQSTWQKRRVVGGRAGQIKADNKRVRI